MTGSTRDARRAGRSQAASGTIARTAAAPESVTGSLGRTPNSGRDEAAGRDGEHEADDGGRDGQPRGAPALRTSFDTFIGGPDVRATSDAKMSGN
jgi:hypothetical protein